MDQLIWRRGGDEEMLLYFEGEYDIEAHEYISLTLAVHIGVQCAMWGSPSKVAGPVIGQQPTWGDLNTCLES